MSHLHPPQRSPLGTPLCGSVLLVAVARTARGGAASICGPSLSRSVLPHLHPLLRHPLLHLPPPRPQHPSGGLGRIPLLGIAGCRWKEVKEKWDGEETTWWEGRMPSRSWRGDTQQVKTEQNGLHTVHIAAKASISLHFCKSHKSAVSRSCSAPVWPQH